MSKKRVRLISLLLVATFGMQFSLSCAEPLKVFATDDLRINGTKDDDCSTASSSDDNDTSGEDGGAETPADVLQREIQVYSAYHQFGFSDALIAGILSA